MAKTKPLVIKRSKWGKNALLNKSKKMCCLGFYACKLGVKQENLIDNHYWSPTSEIASLEELEAIARRERSTFQRPKWLSKKVTEKDHEMLEMSHKELKDLTGSVAEDYLIAINDSSATRVKRESAIAQIFKKYGRIDVEFVD